MSIAGWAYGMGMAGITVTDVIVEIQHGKIAIILNGMSKTNANKESN